MGGVGQRSLKGILGQRLYGVWDESGRMTTRLVGYSYVYVMNYHMSRLLLASLALHGSRCRRARSLPGVFVCRFTHGSQAMIFSIRRSLRHRHWVCLSPETQFQAINHASQLPSHLPAIPNGHIYYRPIVRLIRPDLLDLANDIHAIAIAIRRQDSTKGYVLAVKMWRGSQGDEELRAICVWACILK